MQLQGLDFYLENPFSIIVIHESELAGQREESLGESPSFGNAVYGKEARPVAAEVLQYRFRNELKALDFFV